MPGDIPKLARYPLLETVLACKGMPMKAIFTIKDLANLFNVSIRTIQSRVARGQLVPRDLPGRAKYLAVDLEKLLQSTSGAAPEIA